MDQSQGPQLRFATRPQAGLLERIFYFVLGLIVLVGALGHGPDEGERIAPPLWRPLLVVVGSVLAAGFLLPRAGMLITLPLVIVLTALASSEFRLREALGLAAVLTTGSWLLFVVGLKLRIPVMPTAF